MGAKVDFLDSYNTVAERISEFTQKHPEGSLQQVSLDFQEVNGRWWVIYTAAAYRTPEDVRPGIGTAWEPVPGTTPYTRDSEVQNAETAAWGRAIVAALAAETKKGIASYEEVRNRQAQKQEDDPWKNKASELKSEKQNERQVTNSYVAASVVERFQKELKNAQSQKQIDAIRQVAAKAGTFAPEHRAELVESAKEAEARIAVVEGLGAEVVQ